MHATHRILYAGISLIIGLAVMLGGHQVSSREASQLRPVSAVAESAHPPVAVCFAPGTPDDYMQEWQRRIWGGHPLDYNIGDRWQQTATNPSTGSPGDPVVLTYSFIPDGVEIQGMPSELYARMNELFNGNDELWQAKIAEVFDRWSELSGLSYQYVSDDGAEFGFESPGELGVRGDVRIGSIGIDGSSGVLAYNYFPDGGDMVLDASENWSAPSQNYIFLRNIVAHEHGHGWGLAHVCPVNSTKLLEPYYSSGFNGPQHDDIRAVQRNYGDNFEPNDDAAGASGLGLLSEDFVLENVSLDDNTDIDFYRFAAPAGTGFTLELSPVGHAYLDGPQNEDGSCTPGTTINTLDDQNLDLYLRSSIGGGILAQSATHPNGESERIYRYEPAAQGDSFVVEISGASENRVQLYKLEFDIFNLADPYLTVTPLDFDTTQINQPVTLTTTVVNNASQTLTINSIGATGPFTVTPTGTHDLPPQGSLELSVTYNAESLGTQSGVLTVTHNGPGGMLECPLVGTSVTSSLQFVTGQEAEFGEVPINTTDSANVVVRAQGNVPTSITGLILIEPFWIAEALPITLNPTQALILRPRFSPTVLGDANGIMIIHHTAPSSPDTVYLHGVGAPNLDAPEAPVNLPTQYRLAQNYPNPFNPATTIAFDLPLASHVKLEVYNINGRLVQALVNHELPAGRHIAQFDGAALPSGVYLYRLTTPEFSDLGKMMLLK